MYGKKDALIILDFDGVVADSEILAAEVLFSILTSMGVGISLEATLYMFGGRSIEYVKRRIYNEYSIRSSDSFEADFSEALVARLEADLKPVEGAKQFIDYFHKEVPICIATSSPMRQVLICKRKLGICNIPERDVFSAQLVRNDKPKPDIFKFAAISMGKDPTCCIVLEDSANGVRAGVAAGMSVVGILAGSHVRQGHGDCLLKAGADHIAKDFEEAALITDSLLRVIRA